MSMVSSKRLRSIVMMAVFLGGFIVFNLAGRYLMPALVYARHKQPVDFSHKIHGEEVEIECATCHFFYDDGSWSGIPTIEVCANCHSEVLGESKAEEKLVTDYIQQNREVDWALYFRQPQCVSFSHQSHVRWAKLACETCHGPQGLSGRPAEYLANRITKYTYVIYGDESSMNLGAMVQQKEKNVWGTMGMDECAACHRARGTSTACFICHR